VGDYLINLTPSMLYQITPLAVLIAVLVTFGVLNRNSEIIAMKATGISLYRLVVPIVSIAAILAVGLFLFDQFYLPQANRRQEALRNIIKGRPPQTVLHPNRMDLRPAAPGEPGRIFYYQFFDPDRNEFANLSIFEFDPSTFALSRRIFAARATWDPATGSWLFLNGWQRDIDGANVTDYREFQQTTFSEIHEEPGYFKKESLQSQEMNFGQLDATSATCARAASTPCAARRPVAQARLPADHRHHGRAGHSLRALHGPPRLAHRHRRGHRRGAGLLGRRWPLRRHGQRELPARPAGRLVLGSSLRPGGRLPAAANADVRTG
jgi:hypothetical protein